MLTVKTMRASFGKLQDAELRLKPGLNVISGGNEAGKSTWAEFLIAMFYGVDTRSRGRNGQLPVKTKYLPWSGVPMSGTLELEQDGRPLILERRSESGPMAEICLRDAATGEAVADSARPGEMLLGVEASVYRRSGYLRQRGPAVSSDPNLEKRLSALVSSGREDCAYAEVDGALKKLEYELQYNQSGALPRLREQRQRTAETLETIGSLQERLTSIRAERDDRSAEARRLEAAEENAAALESQRTLEQAQARLDEAEEDREGWEAVCRELPENAFLQRLQVNLADLREEMDSAAVEALTNPVTVPDLPEDMAFYQMNEQQAFEKGSKDAAYVRANVGRTRLRLAEILLRLLPALAAGALAAVGPGFLPGQFVPLLRYGFAGLAAVLLVLAAVSCLRTARRMGETAREIGRLLNWYDAEDADGIMRRTADYMDQAADCAARREAANEVLRDRQKRAEVLDRQRQTLLERLQPYAPGCDSLEQAEIFLTEAARSKNSLDQASRKAERCREELSMLTERLGGLSPVNPDPAFSGETDRTRIRQNLAACRQRLTELRSEADRLAGAVEQLGDPLGWNAALEEQDRQIRRMEDRLGAIQLARRALSEADAELRSRFSPLLCQRAGALFARLTGGKYDRLLMDREFRITVHPTGSATDRSLAYLSGGTADQLYLALRLAICDLLLPGMPIILDDALVYFDEKRAELALDTLVELGRDRQILLFTCHGREKRLLDARQGAEARSRGTEGL